MDQNSIRKTSLVTGIIYLILAILLVPMSISLMLQASGITFIIALTFLITGVTCLLAFIRNIRYRKEIESITLKTLPTTQAEVISWDINPTEWADFYTTETKRRTGNLLLESVVVIIAGSVILIFSKPISFKMSFLFTVPIGLIYYFIKHYTLLAKLPKKGKAVNITISLAAVSFNDITYPLNSSRSRVRLVELKQGNPDYLEITYEWPLRKGGVAAENIRVPIASGENEKVKAAIQLLYPSHH